MRSRAYAITTTLLILLAAGCGEFPARLPLFDVGAGADGAPPSDMEPDPSDTEPDPDDTDPPPGDMDPPPEDGPPRPPEVCNGRDDDDDGRIDEDASPAAECREGEGSCAIVGIELCRRGVLVCDGDPVAPMAEQCNGADDDCDGDIDETFPLGVACTAGAGVCAVGGRIACRDGSVGCDASPRDELSEVERCDGLDNDCDGSTDEAEDVPGPLTEACQDLEQQGECRRGERTCRAEPASGMETWSACESVVMPAMNDPCDGLDNDCDGTTDDGFAIGQPCDFFPGGIICPRQGVFRCAEDGLSRVCQPRPETECNGLDDNCDGVVDDGPACAELITRECRAWLGWTTRELENPGERWGNCPAAPELAADLSCNGSGPGRGFGQLDLFGDLDAADDRLGVRFGCRANASLLVDYIADHCALYLGVAAADSAPPDGAESWSSCPDEPVGGDADAACTSGDDRFRPMPLPIDLDEGAVLGAAFRCTDLIQPSRAEAMAGAVEVLIAWADASLDEPAPDWEAICAPGGDGDARTACVSTGGDGRFHAMPFTADVDAGDKLAIGIRPRPAP